MSTTNDKFHMVFIMSVLVIMLLGVGYNMYSKNQCDNVSITSK